jgi:threonine/homoserine/homoserine lactone efflux protein
MFDYSLVHWVSFITVALLLHLSPGPDMAFILGQTFKGGRVKGFSAMGGIWLGAACHALIAAFGLSAVLMTSASAFLVVKWVGAVYLIWLGVQALGSKGSSFLSSDTSLTVQQASNWKIFRQGLMVSLLNPKVAIFFMAFLPQFVVAGAGSTSAQLLLHGILVVLIAGLVEPPIILLADRLAGKFRNSKKYGLWMDRCLGCLLISLGIKLAASER